MENTIKLNTDNPIDEIELVEKARQGDRQSLNRLAGMARERLRVYVYRLTQKDDLTQEIVQESLLEMCKILGKLQKTDRFWPWLYGIATNKLHRHYRTEKAMRHAAAAEERRRGSMEDRQRGLEDLVSEELKQIVSNAMQGLRTRHKAVLVMRCYDGMSYSDIAESMGCNEFSIRMLFVRAKKALQKELLRNGFGRGSLLAALIVFGKMTAPSKAAAAQLTVPAAALKVGLAASVAGLATTSTGIVSIAAAGALTMGTVVTTSNLRPAVIPSASTVTVNSGIASPYATSDATHQSYWFGFPDGPEGAMTLRARARDASTRILQNEEGNFSLQGDTVSKNNYRMWLDDLSVFKLPTDSTDMRGFLAQVEGIRNDIQPVSARKGEPLLAVVERKSENADVRRPWTIRKANVLDGDYFQSDWPAGTRMVDNRDEMHRRMWTYFRVRGEVRGQSVAGTGRIPFVYATARQHSAWLQLKIGDTRSVVDSGPTAVLQDAQGTALGHYARGSFFKGLSRPWMGLHTIDSVRRDAAEQRTPFETQLLAGGREAQVTVLSDQTRLVYLIDIEADLVRRIDFFVDQAQVGTLEFEYLQDVRSVGSNEFVAPAARSERASVRNSAGLLWLVRLANGQIGG